MVADDVFHWAKTVGAPRPEDRRDGELHKVFGETPAPHFDLEPWDDDPDGIDARYVLSAGGQIIDERGRSVWVYTYDPLPPDGS